jgi:hypothetical protein
MSRNRIKNSQSMHWMGVMKWVLIAGMLSGLGLGYIMYKNQNLHLAAETQLLKNQLDAINRRNWELSVDLDGMKSPQRLQRRLAEIHSALIPWGDVRANWVRMDQDTRARLARIGTMPRPSLNLDSSAPTADAAAPQPVH